MPDPVLADSRPVDPPDPRAGDARSDARRTEEHRAVERLADGLLPALIEKLAATGLAELEVREGSWKVRLRRPLEVVGTGRRATDRQFRLPVAGGAGGHPAPGHAAPGHAPSPGPRGHEAARPAGEREAPVVASPAVGIFRPRTGIAGTRVRAGDRLGAVEMLGVPQEVVAPVDGIVGGLLAEVGEGVEYGQALIEMRPAPASASSAQPAAEPPAERVAAPAGKRA